MISQLQAKLKKRQETSGLVVENEPKKTEQVKVQKKVQHQSNSEFQANKNRLKAFFEQKQGGGQVKTQDKAPAPKQQVKGNSQGFANARKLLQQNMGKPSSIPSVLDLPPLPTISFGDLPPLPPPPPSGGFSNSPLPPPPSLDFFNLPPPPPPPSISNLILPPPPPMNTQILPPPPSLNQHTSNQQKTSQALPFNLPPPPPLVFQKPKQAQPTKIQINLPPPPPPPATKTIQTPAFNLPLPPPPPSFQIIQPTQTQQTANESGHFKKTQSLTVQMQPQIQKPPEIHIKIQKPHQQIKIQQKPQQKVFQVIKPPPTAKKARESTRNKKPNVTQQFFGNDVAGFIKREFIKQTDILNTIGSKVEKRLYNFNFPSIENHIREIQPIEALYADGSSLDLVSCYMQKNVNAARKHIEARQAFTNTLKLYNWGTDPQRLKLIRQSIDGVPKDFKYRQLNFVQIKNALNRCDNLIKSFIKFQNFEACAQIKKLREQTDKLVNAYCKNPEANEQAYDEIEILVQKIKDTKI